MSTTTNVNQVKLNIMTEAQYSTATKSPTEFYLVTDANSDGQIIQVATLPTASVAEVNNIYQYIGNTNANYTNGYFYKCVSDGALSPTYSWTAIDVQAGGGGSSLPSQTGHTGQFLRTDGTDASWENAVTNEGLFDEDFIVGNNAHTKTNTCRYNTLVGTNAYSTDHYGVAVGYNSRTCYGAVAVGGDSKVQDPTSGLSLGSIALGAGAICKAGRAMQISMAFGNGTDQTNNDPNTVKIANANGNFEMMSSDGTIPTDRFTTTPSAAGVYVPTITVANGSVTRSWETSTVEAYTASEVETIWNSVV